VSGWASTRCATIRCRRQQEEPPACDRTPGLTRLLPRAHSLRLNDVRVDEQDTTVGRGHIDLDDGRRVWVEPAGFRRIEVKTTRSGMLAATGGPSMATKKPATKPRTTMTAGTKVGPLPSSSVTSRGTRGKEPLWSEIFDQVSADGIPDLLRGRTKQERMAYTLGLFKSQMHRNGAQFWLTNGYAGSWNTLVMQRLRELGTATARKVALILVEIRAIATPAAAQERKRARTDREMAERDAVLDALAQRCRRVDRRFYELAPQLMGEVDAFLRGEPLRRATSSSPWPRLPPMTEAMKNRWG